METEIPHPSEGAADQHVISAYLQYHDWAMLDSMTLNTTEYGGRITNSVYELAGNSSSIPPEQLLKLIVCKAN